MSCLSVSVAVLQVTHRREQHTKRIKTTLPGLCQRVGVKTREDLLEYLIMNLATATGGQLLASFLISEQNHLPCCANGADAFLDNMMHQYPAYSDMVGENGSLVVAKTELRRLIHALKPPPAERPRPNLGAPSSAGQLRQAPDLSRPPPPPPPPPADGASSASSSASRKRPMAGPVYSTTQAEAVSFALAVRPRHRQSAAARKLARDHSRIGAMQLMQGALARAREMRVPADSSLIVTADRALSRRGRALNASNIESELVRLQQRLNSERLRDQSPEDLDEGEEGGEHGVDYGRGVTGQGGAAAEGRGAGAAIERPPPPPTNWFQLRPPADFDLGWFVEVVFPTGEHDELRWFGGIVFEIDRSSEAASEHRIHVFFADDAFEDWFSDPIGDPNIAFHTRGRCHRTTCSCRAVGPCASKAEVERVRRLFV
jgi:hypothetical protein